MSRSAEDRKPVVSLVPEANGDDTPDPEREADPAPVGAVGASRPPEGGRPAGRLGDALFGGGDADWPVEAKRTWRAARIIAFGLLAVWLLGWPLGNTIGASLESGRFVPVLGYTVSILLLAPTTAALALGIGYAIAAGLRLEDSAQRLAAAATGFAGGLGPRGLAARSEIDALNAEIDHALGRLAEAESLIRRQVQAISTAGETAQATFTRGSENLDAKRRELMMATEEVNKEAEAFAEAIAARSRGAVGAGDELRDRITASEKSLDDRIVRLEAVSARSLERFETLANAMEGRSEALSSQADAQSEATAKLGENASALAKAQADLSEQSARLEALIRDQRRRADKLARAVTDQTTRLKGLGQKPPAASARRGAWRDILASVERSLPGGKAEPRAEASEADVKAAMDQLVERMQRFSLTMRTQLFGGPKPGDLARFESGERLLFVRELLDGDQGELRERVAREAERNAVFEQAVREFLGDFDALMEPVSNAAEADAAMAEYLRSPLGRLYVLVGTALGRFDRRD